MPISTEWAVKFGDQGNENLHLSKDGYKETFEKWFRSYSAYQKVPLIMQHRISGDPTSRLTSNPIPYNRRSR